MIIILTTDGGLTSNMFKLLLRTCIFTNYDDIGIKRGEVLRPSRNKGLVCSSRQVQATRKLAATSCIVTVLMHCGDCANVFNKAQ